jgi:hypothetical protein
MGGGEGDKANAMSREGNVVLHCSIEAPPGMDGKALQVSNG